MIDTFADIIRHRRSNLKLTMDKLAEKARVNKSIISRIENGEVKKPEITTIKSLAEALEITYDEYIRIYISLERNAEVILKILQEAISISCPAPLITEIATRYLELPLVDSYDAIEQIFTTANDVNDTAIKLELFKKVVSYSREHGVMTYIAKGMYQVYMIERNDFSKLNSLYHYGKNILNYANFLNDNDRIVLHYCLAVHAYSLMLYEDSLQFSEYVINHTNKDEYKAATINNIIFCLYNLKRFEESRIYLEDYKKIDLPYVNGNSKMFEGFLTLNTGNVELALLQLESYLKLSSEYNLVYVVSELMNIYLTKSDFDSALTLLVHESQMKISLNDLRTTPDKWARLAFFYQLVGKLFLLQDVNKAFEYYLKSAKEYLNIGLINNALESLAFINMAIIEDSSRFDVNIAIRTNEMYFTIINKK
ncbi:helix-turn-helix domain-containing protein [Paenibacillus arenosi]|uniref:Helix-turn-helix transcriptional regulator n=1 Tax=Paenibacillus arenosi TaxID=2774142 RepID=A0ABR9AUQ8_9BACL|nr:helix-turn-helix domain-containing protein [Paenibacillus arenosi]MBD8496972.1 helix-turn-helix transcriptional regulator [Paenibacillus arenosi]